MLDKNKGKVKDIEGLKRAVSATENLYSKLKTGEISESVFYSAVDKVKKGYTVNYVDKAKGKSRADLTSFGAGRQNAEYADIKAKSIATSVK
jgi:hypothetical protein